MTTSLGGIPLNENDLYLKAVVETLPMQDSINATFEKQVYHTVNVLGREDRLSFTGGDTIEDRIELGPDGTANRVESWEEVPLDQEDNFHTSSCRLVSYHKPYMIEDEELDANRSGDRAQKIIDVVKARRLPPLRAISASLESDTWSTPMSASDTRRMRGFPYWLNKAESGTTGSGFNGQTVRFTGGTTSNEIGGIDASTETMWRNFTSVYTNIDRDFLNKMSEVYHQLDFQPPMVVDDLVKAPYMDFRIYMGLDILLQLEQIAREGGDSFGPDLGDIGGRVAYRRIPFTRINDLDNETDGAVYWANLAHFDMPVREGWWFKEVGPMREARRPLVAVNHIYCKAQLRCTNRRLGGAVMHTQTSS